MTHGTEPNITNEKQAEKRDGSVSSAGSSQEVSCIRTSSTVHEISNESIQVNQLEIRRDSTIDTELSDHLEQYRETLHRSSESATTTTTKPGTDTSLQKTHTTTKSASVGSKKKQKGKRGALPEVSILEDPIGFLANLLTKLERALLRSLQGEKVPPLPQANPQSSMAIPRLKKRKKKKSDLLSKGPQSGTQLTTLYHLEHLNNELHALDIASDQNKNEATQSEN